jgi:uncharacterized iron-regulated protein
MILRLMLLCVTCFSTVSLAADAKTYQVFRSTGERATLDEAVAAADAATVIFLGESHDDPTAHALELEFLRRLQSSGPLVLTLEMFERDVQQVLDEYLDGQITEDHLISSARAWRNYKTDYRAVIEFAKERKVPVVAANAPRRYVNRVSRFGQASLGELRASAKEVLPPLPYAEASERYSKKFRDLMDRMKKDAEDRAKAEGKTTKEPPQRLDPANGLAAQSLWDASMAYSIAETLMRHPKARVLQINGSFHSEERLGILDHLERYRPGSKALVITMISRKSFPEWDAELAGKGDFVIVTDPSPPRTMKSEPPAKPTNSNTQSKGN